MSGDRWMPRLRKPHRRCDSTGKGSRQGCAAHTPHCKGGRKSIGGALGSSLFVPPGASGVNTLPPRLPATIATVQHSFNRTSACPSNPPWCSDHPFLKLAIGATA